MSRMVNVGFWNLVNSDKIISVVAPDAAPIKRLVQHAREDNRFVDATQGRRTKAVIVCEEGYVVLSALQPETLCRRYNGNNMTMDEKGEIDE